MPSQPPAGPAGAPALLAWTAAGLRREPSAAHDLNLIAESCLDLTAGQSGGLLQLLTTRSVRLSAIFGEPDSRTQHLLRLRRFRLTVADLDDQGRHAGYLAAGLVDIEDAQVPVLLRRCLVRPAGAQDAHLDLDGPWRLNPSLSVAARTMSRGGLDIEQVVSLVPPYPGATATAPGVTAEDPSVALDEVGAALSGLRLVLRRRFVLAPVTLDADRAVADLDRVAEHVATHPLLMAVAHGVGEPDQAIAPGDVDLTHGPGGGVGPPDAVDPTTAAALDVALDEVFATPVDAHQRQAIRLVLAGHNAVVDAPAATGATTVATAVAVLAATTGRTCLVLLPTRTQVDLVVQRLQRSGVGGWVATGAGLETVGSGVEWSALQPVGRPGGLPDAAGELGSADERRTRAGTDFAAARQDLTRLREPWQVSRLDALDALARLDAEPADVSVTWPEGEAGRLSLTAVHAVVDAVGRAVGLGAAGEDIVSSPWRGARLADSEAATRALALARELAGPLADRVRTAVTELASLTGTSEAITVGDLMSRQRLFTGLRATLDRLTPEVFDIPVLDLVAATGSREFRQRTAYPISGMARRRLVARARRLVRPGVDVKGSELHDLLVAAAHQRTEWQQIAGGAGWAHVPADAPEQIRVLASFADTCRELGRLHPAFTIGWQPGTGDDQAGAAPERDPQIAAVIWLASRLAASEVDVGHLPELTRLDDVWTAAGAADLVAELFAQLRARPADEATVEVARVAVWRSYWSAVAAATTPDEVAADTAAMLRRYTSADCDHRAGAVGRARAAADRASSPGAWQVRVAVPSDVAGAVGVDRYDVVVIDDAGIIAFADVVAAVARAGQVVALGDLALARADSALSVFSDASAPDMGRVALTVRHRAVPIAHAAGSGTTGSVDEVPVIARPGTVTFTHVPDAVGLPAEGDDYADTSDAEVTHVVEHAIRLAEAGTAASPPRSLAVVALTRAHASAIALGLRGALRRAPERAVAFAADRDEPVIVVSADQARGIERDVVLVSVGFPRTPHGRVLHRFGPLEARQGASLVATAVTRARSELHVVSGLRAADLDPSRLHSEGARAVAALLSGAELAATGVAPARQGPPEPTADGPVTFDRRGGTSHGDDVCRLVERDLSERGLMLGPGPMAQGLAVAAPREQPIALDLDIAFADAAAALTRSQRLTEAGWRHVVLPVEQLAADRITSVSRIEDTVRGGVSVDLNVAAVVAAATGDVIAHRSSDDSDVGWNDSATTTDNDERLRAERPPHW